MIVYLWDSLGLYAGQREVGQGGRLPMHSTLTPPPATVGEEVARWTGQGWIVLPEAPSVPGPSLDALKAGLTAQCNAGYEEAIGLLTADYPPSEISTWDVQRQEAGAWAADPDAATPWITAAAAARGLDRQVFLERTYSKALAFAQVSAFLTGRRQAIEDAIHAAADASVLAAIDIDYALPGT